MSLVGVKRANQRFLVATSDELFINYVRRKGAAKDGQKKRRLVWNSDSQKPDKLVNLNAWRKI
jgi:hypothetical protein